MFKIDTNQVIRIDRGDNGSFTLFLNKGTAYQPIQHKFSVEDAKIFLYKKYGSTIVASINFNTWKSKSLAHGSYDFEYTADGWTLNTLPVTIAEYGITVLNQPLIGDIIEVLYTSGKNEEVYFQIVNYNGAHKPALLKKTIIANRTNVDSDGCLIFTLEPDDTRNIRPGKYLYSIKAKIYNGTDYEINTVIKYTDIWITEAGT